MRRRVGVALVVLFGLPFVTVLSERPAHISPLISGAQIEDLSEFFEPEELALHSQAAAQIQDRVTNLCAGMALSWMASLAQVGWGVCQVTSWADTIGRDFRLFRSISAQMAYPLFVRAVKGVSSPSYPALPGGAQDRPSHYSWRLNRALLSKVPIETQEDQKLLSFLQERWLAKSSGYSSWMVDWLCPLSGVTVQVHPETCHSYARNPGSHLSQTYVKRSEAWKRSHVQPLHFPLILTRPFDLCRYLEPFAVKGEDEIEAVVDKIAAQLQTHPHAIVDFTDAFERGALGIQEWTRLWDLYRSQFLDACKDRDIDARRVVCLMQEHEEGVGGIRLLPLDSTLPENDPRYRALLDWVSHFGLTANRVELDRYPSAPIASSILRGGKERYPHRTRQEFIGFLETFDENWKTTSPQKALMVRGTMRLLKGLLANSEAQWEAVEKSPTRIAIVQLVFAKIEAQLQLLLEKPDTASFFEIASQLEQVHADLMSLLEIFSPYQEGDFSRIYSRIVTRIPSSLKQITSYGVHASGMTSLGGILRAVGPSPLILYGRNTYYENLAAAQEVGRTRPTETASDDELREADLIIAHFNPVLSLDPKRGEYRAEEVAVYLRRALELRGEKPLTLALDSTIDYLDSPRAGELLVEFREEIERGRLNVVAYRSGLKFDQFGMDNYCGSPFFMIHSQDPKWASFDLLLSDPVLQTDRLSYNWFCLAYQHVARELELYRTQVFDNTRALLKQIPPRLLEEAGARYQVSRVDGKADPAFIDLKVVGPMHQIRGALLMGSCLYQGAMSGGHPIFTRLSFGFYHPNFFVMFGEEMTTLRLTLGLDPAQVDVFANLFRSIDALNTNPRK